MTKKTRLALCISAYRDVVISFSQSFYPLTAGSSERRSAPWPAEHITGESFSFCLMSRSLLFRPAAFICSTTEGNEISKCRGFILQACNQAECIMMY